MYCTRTEAHTRGGGAHALLGAAGLGGAALALGAALPLRAGSGEEGAATTETWFSPTEKSDGEANQKPVPQR